MTEIMWDAQSLEDFINRYDNLQERLYEIFPSWAEAQNDFDNAMSRYNDSIVAKDFDFVCLRDGEALFSNEEAGFYSDEGLLEVYMPLETLYNHESLIKELHDAAIKARFHANEEAKSKALQLAGRVAAEQQRRENEERELLAQLKAKYE